MAEMRPDEPRIPDVRAGGRRWGPSRWVPLAALAGVALFGFGRFADPAGGTQQAKGPQAISVAQAEPGAKLLDPAIRERLVVAFADGFWVPIEGARPQPLPDDQMNVVGTGDTLRVYARAGGGGGGPTLDWRAGDVFVKVGKDLYLPLRPQTRTPPPAQVRPDHRPLSEPAPAPAPKAGDR
jgi:hypothetical protein